MRPSVTSLRYRYPGLRVTKNSSHTLHQLFEALLGLLQLSPASRSEFVILGAPIRLGQRPFRRDPPALLHAMQSRIERSFFHPQHVVRSALDVQDNSVAVQCAVLIQRL